jgi:hypothetical protein
MTVEEKLMLYQKFHETLMDHKTTIYGNFTHCEHCGDHAHDPQSGDPLFADIMVQHQAYSESFSWINIPASLDPIYKVQFIEQGKWKGSCFNPKSQGWFYLYTEKTLQKAIERIHVSFIEEAFGKEI